MKTYDPGIGWRGRLLAAALMALLALALFVVASYAGSPPPRSITVTAPVKFVTCGGPVCCGQISTIYQGHWYSAPRGYCKWFVQLHEGQPVKATLTLWR